MEQERYLTTAEISAITRLSKQVILRRARKEQWETREQITDGRKTEFVFSRLPENIRKLIADNEPSAPDIRETPDENQSDNKEMPSPPSEEAGKETKDARPQAQENNDPPPNIRLRDFNDMMKKISANSLIIMGKSGIGKTYLLKLLARELSKTFKVIHFDEPPTAKTILLNLLIAADAKSGSNSDESIRNLEGYQGERIILCIDKLENMTPSAIQVIDRLFGFSWFRFIGAGHLWSKRRFNSTWKKAKGMMLHYLSRHEATRLLDYHWKEGDSRSKRTIIDEARGIPGQIVRMASEAKQGIMPKSEQKYLDATPFVLVIATIGLAVRVIGYGYQSTETYIMGGIIASVFWGLFWIYRGYVAGWWGTKSQLSRKHR